jgi:hypothetical protein
MTTEGVEAGGNRVRMAASRIGGQRRGGNRRASKQQIGIRLLSPSASRRPSGHILIRLTTGGKEAGANGARTAENEIGGW